MKILVVGSKGQDGTILSSKLSREGHQLVGIHSKGIEPAFLASEGPVSLSDYRSIESLFKTIAFDQVYYLAAIHGSSQDQVNDDSVYFSRSNQINVGAFHCVLDAIRKYTPQTRVFYACSSHIFAETAENPQNENSAFAPNSVYGITKLAGHLLARMYRRKYDLFVVSGILYNHESPLRTENYLSKKIVKNAVLISAGKLSQLEIGNLESIVDWGHAYDYVDAMRLCLALSEPEEFIIATGEGRSVREFVTAVFSELDLDWKKYTRVNSSIAGEKRKPLVGNPSKLVAVGWARKYSFVSMIRDLITQTKQEMNL